MSGETTDGVLPAHETDHCEQNDRRDNRPDVPVDALMGLRRVVAGHCVVCDDAGDGGNRAGAQAGDEQVGRRRDGGLGTSPEQVEHHAADQEGDREVD